MNADGILSAFIGVHLLISAVAVMRPKAY